MNKLVAYLKSKVEDRKVANKVKRVELALSSAELNFKSTKDDNEVRLEELLEEFKDSDNIEDVIQEISETMDNIDEANEGLTKIDRIKKFLFEEI